MKRALLALGLGIALTTSATGAFAATPASLYVDPYAQVVGAAKSDARLGALATIPQGKWFTGWTTVASIKNDVSSYVKAADKANQMPVVVLYQIPGRDCGGYSSGGLTTEADYDAWIDGAAAALVGHPAIVIIEPDALAQLGNCATPGDRVAMLRYAAQKTSAAGARVYLDAGHSNWQAPAVMAQRLVDAGVQYARGFSTNVANFLTTDAEVAYATQVTDQLAALGVAGKHYVIDTGRNGNGSTGDVCNPPTARTGVAPKLFTSGPLDAYLWVKNVGETDGACNAGPASGFSTTLALALLGNGKLKAPHKPSVHRSGSRLVATWKKSTGAAAYKVIFTPKKGKAITKIVTTTKYVLTKPKKHTKYKVQVAAYNGAGYSFRSTAATITSK